MRACVHALCGTCLVGCVGELVGLPGSAAPDLAQPPAGERADASSPSLPGFDGVQADLDRLYCTACHGPARPPALVRAPASVLERDLNYQRILVEVRLSAPESSPLLRRPAGLDGHPQVFSMSDATYPRWLEWIRAGAPR
jgi:hypothetical protein